MKESNILNNEIFVQIQDKIGFSLKLFCTLKFKD